MMISIEQLKAAYYTIHGQDADDIHKLRAAYEFNVPYDAVTHEMRMVGKKINFPEHFMIPATTARISKYRPQI